MDIGRVRIDNCVEANVCKYSSARIFVENYRTPREVASVGIDAPVADILPSTGHKMVMILLFVWGERDDFNGEIGRLSCHETHCRRERRVWRSTEKRSAVPDEDLSSKTLIATHDAEHKTAF